MTVSVRVYGVQDYKEGVSAVAAKRAPTFHPFHAT